jgi:hypothetical protein
MVMLVWRMVEEHAAALCAEEALDDSERDGKTWERGEVCGRRLVTLEPPPPEPTSLVSKSGGRSIWKVTRYQYIMLSSVILFYIFIWKFPRKSH